MDFRVYSATVFKRIKVHSVLAKNKEHLSLENFDALVVKKAALKGFPEKKNQLPEELLIQYSFPNHDGSWLLDHFFLDRGRTGLSQIAELSNALARDLVIGRNVMNRSRDDYFGIRLALYFLFF